MSTNHPLLSVWLHPRRTVRALVETNPEYGVIPLMCVFGIVRALDRASVRSAGDDLPLAAVLGIAVVAGPIGGLFMLWLITHLLRWTGTWLGGDSPRSHLRTAVAWCSVPTACILALWLPELLLFGEELFTSEMPRIESNTILLVAFGGFTVVEFTLGIWSLVLICNGIAEVQGYASAWRGFANLALSGLGIMAPLVVVVTVVLMLDR